MDQAKLDPVSLHCHRGLYSPSFSSLIVICPLNLNTVFPSGQEICRSLSWGHRFPPREERGDLGENPWKSWVLLSLTRLNFVTCPFFNQSLWLGEAGRWDSWIGSAAPWSRGRASSNRILALPHTRKGFPKGRIQEERGGNCVWEVSWVGFPQKHILRQGFQCKCFIQEVIPGSREEEWGSETGNRGQPMQSIIKPPLQQKAAGA